ncbi:polysaccharide deacetylase family protein [Thiomicrolovo sp. ZZH C-3]
MIVVSIPDNNLKERTYIVDMMLDVFLGLDYELKTGSTHYEILLENGNKLIVEDHFFNKFPNNLEYLEADNIPLAVNFQSNTENRFIPENDIPVIYGIDRLELKSGKQQSQTVAITCGIDIFASAFFMLTRWEEHVQTGRDGHGRFPATASLAYQNGFLHRPVVNEYAEMLWNMLEHLGINQKRKTSNRQLFLTHDVDQLYFWKNAKQLLRITTADFLKRHDPKLALERFREFLRVEKGLQKDPFDTFDWLMDLSESIGTTSRFYFMSGGVTAYDNRYRINEPRAVELMQKIKERGHIIGIHTSYNSYNDPEQFAKEKALLEEACECEITEGRQHYLRFDVPATWRVWEENGMETDSTCGYADSIGFRCGTGDAFRVFDILKRETLSLRERPLVVMDCSLFDYQGLGEEEALKAVAKVREAGSSVTFLWHNSYGKYRGFYEKLIKGIE